MAMAIRTGMIMISPCLTVAAMMLILSGCVAHGIETPALPLLSEDTALILHGTASPAITAGPGEPKVSLTIHSARKEALVGGRAPKNGVWVIVDLSIENRGFSGGVFLNQHAMVLTDPETGQIYPSFSEDVQLMDRWTDGDAGFRTTKRGEILFVTDTSPDTYILTINDISGSPLYQTVVKTTGNSG